MMQADLVSRVLSTVLPTSFSNIKKIARTITEEMRKTEPGFTLTNLGLGSPALKPPAELRELHKHFIDACPPGYDAFFEGNELLRTVAAEMFSTYFGLPARPENVYITPGAMALNHIVWDHLAYLCMRGESPKLFFFEPGYAEVPDQLEELGLDVLVPLSLAVYRGDRLKDIGALAREFRAADKERPLFISWSTLGNPIPVSFTPAEYDLLDGICEEYNITPIEDAAYFIAPEHWKGSMRTIRTNAVVAISLSKLLGVAGERCALVYVASGLQQQMTGTRQRLSQKAGINEFTSRIRHTVTHTPLALQLALAEYLNRPQLAERIREYIQPYHVWCNNAWELLQQSGHQLSMTNPDGSLPKVFYLPVKMDFEEMLRRGILTIPLSMFSTNSETRVEGVRIAIPGIMPDCKTGDTTQYEQFCQRSK